MNLFEILLLIVIVAFMVITTWAWLDVRKMIVAYAHAGESVCSGVEKVATAVEAEIPELIAVFKEAAEQMGERKEDEDTPDDEEE